MRIEHVFTDASRFKQLSKLLLKEGHTSFPNFRQIQQLASVDLGLRAWIRGSSKAKFMHDAEFFFYRERNRNAPRMARTT